MAQLKNTTITGTLGVTSTITPSTLTASEIVITDASKGLASAAVATYPSLTELSYVKGLTSAVQTQINGKAATSQKLDDFGTPDDNTDLNANTTNHGLLLKATAPASGLYNYVGITNGETAYTNKALFDATSPSTQAFGDSAVVGTAAVAARRDHKHAMMAAPTSVSGNAGTVTVAAETGDATCSVLFATNVSGSLAPKTNTNLTFNASTGVLTSASAVLTTADINGGTFDNTTIGASTPSTIVGTTIQANTGFIPDANDGAYLGTTTAQFSDLFLAEGGVINWDNGDATLTQTNNVLKLAGAAFETDGNIELGHATDTTLSRSAAGVLAVEGVVIPSISSTNTLTNKRITRRSGTTTSSATPTINTDNVDFYSLTAQAEAITSFTTNLSGTPTEGQTLWIAITGTAARAITWGTSFEASTVALPTTTVTTNRLDCGFVWNTVTSKWRIVATA